jgi:hypothetical protein
MKYLIATLVLLIGFLFIESQGSHFDPFHRHEPRWEPRTVSVGPVSYTTSECVENCDWTR